MSFRTLTRSVIRALIAVAALGSASAYAQDIPIRIAVVGSVTQPLNIIFTGKYFQDSVLKDYGKAYTVKLNRVTSTPLAAQLFVTGQVDIAMLAGPAISNAILSGVIDKEQVAIVAAGITDGYPGYVSSFWAAMKSSGITGVEQLRGKTIAVLGFGTASDTALRVVLRRHGLDPEKDVRIVELPLQNMPDALRQGRVDAAQFTEPFSAHFRAAGDGVELFSHADAFGGPSYNTVALIRKDTAARLGGALRAYLADFSRGLYWLSDPKNRDQAIAVASDTTGLTTQALAVYYLTKLDKYTDPELCIDRDWLQTPLAKAVEAGVIPQVVDLRPLVTSAYLPGLQSTCK